MSMAKDGKTLLMLAAILFCFTAAITLIYLWVVPAFFPGFKTRLILSLGVLGALLSSGFIVYRNMERSASVIRRAATAAISSIVVAFLVFSFSMLIILNIAGS